MSEWQFFFACPRKKHRFYISSIHEFKNGWLYTPPVTMFLRYKHTFGTVCWILLYGIHE